MGLSYDSAARQWNVEYENTAFDVLPTNQDTVNNFTTVLIKKGDDIPNFISGSWVDKDFYANQINKKGKAKDDFYITVTDADTNAANAALKEANETLNKQYATLKAENEAKNNAYNTVLSVVNSTQGGDYTSQRDLIRSIQGVDSTLLNTFENNYKTYYLTEKLNTWDLSLGAKPPYGDFDADYYSTQNPAAADTWNQAVANDDIDITSRYGEEGFYLYHYTTQGKPSGARGNQVEETEAANKYVEEKPTDSDLQLVRDLQLGIDLDTQTSRLLDVPEVAEEWEKAKAGDEYWTQLAKDNYLDVDKEDDFAALFRLSERDEDKQIAFDYSLNTGYGITDLEDALLTAVGEKATIDVKKFGALAQDVLKETIKEIKQAKVKEQTLEIFSGLSGFKEIMDVNKSLANSILGDSGVGGIFSFAGGDSKEEKNKLEKALENVTGIKNSLTYNWEDWFNNELVKRYETDLELGYTTEEAEEKLLIEADFAKEFINNYLVPRFNESRSMNEFVEYLDVRQSEQNPFQTQDLVNAAKLIADIRAEKLIDDLKSSDDRYFDSEFYFNPTGNKAREEDYKKQSETVTSDWEAAKAGDEYWASQAYRFGIDINDKEAFAKMHFQVKGRGEGYDAADDILNASKVSDYIYNEILPALEEEVLEQGTIFGQFITPEEFADEMLEGLDPSDKESWKEVLEQYDLDDFKGTLDELKDYIKETLQTGSAYEIRQQIKYLNEKKEKPTQEKLGVTYIQREEDYDSDKEVEGETELYKIFQQAGFEGTEENFYNDFFPDLDKTEQVALTKAGTNTKFKFDNLDLSDPFASLGTIEKFFDEDEKTDTSKDKETGIDYLKIGDEDEEDILPKTKSGQGFLDEFTSMFK